MSQSQSSFNTKVIASSVIEIEVANAVESLRKLMVTPVKSELEAIVAAELHYGHSDGEVEDKVTFIETLISKKSDFLSITLFGQTINVYDGTAVVRHILQAQTNDGQILRNIQLMVLSIWHNQNGSWKIVARQSVKAT